MRNSFLSNLVMFFTVGIFSLCLQSTGYAAGTSPDGLELVGFGVITKSTTPKVGDTVKVTFKLKNVTGGPIQFSPTYGVFVGARWNSTTDANNRDFGHKFKGKVLKPGGTCSFTGTRKLDAAGTWRFWPAYNVNGHWGPFRWNESMINVAEVPTVGTQQQGGSGVTSPDGLELTGFGVVTKSTTPKVGDTVKVTFKLKNVTGGPIQFSPTYGVFVGARWNSTTDANNRDFGHKFKGKVLKPGGTCSFTGTRKLDAAGTWRFWPAYNVNGHWGPFRWNESVVNVAEGTASGK